MVALIAAAEPDILTAAMTRPSMVSSRGSRTPDSGLYAQIRSQTTMSGARLRPRACTIDFGPPLAQGEREFSYAMVGHDRVAIESRGISFEDDPKQGQPLTFSVAVSLTPYEQQLWLFRSRVLGWFSGLMVLLLAVPRRAAALGARAAAAAGARDPRGGGGAQRDARIAAIRAS